MDSTKPHHVQIATPADGEPRARHYCVQVLGLPETPKPPNFQRRGGVWFEAGTLQLHLGADPAFTRAKKVHVAFGFSNPDEVRSRLAASGFRIEADEPLPRYGRFYSSDPFGNRIALFPPREA